MNLSAQYLFTLLILLLPFYLISQDNKRIIFPPDARIWNVKDYGAKGDGIADDTEAFKKAITASLDHKGVYGAMRILYVPNGVYKVTDRLDAKNLNTDRWFGWRSGFFLQGESAKGTIIKLADNTPGFRDPSNPKAVIRTGSEFNVRPDLAREDGAKNEAFRHYIKNLTVDVGRRNPGAIGIDYLVNNRGAMVDVIIKSSDPNYAGHTGLSMDREWPGPGLVKNVTVEGFQYGISMWRHSQYGMTFEHITLKNQTVYGFRAQGNTASFRDLRSENAVPVIFSDASQSHLTIIDAVFTGGNSNRPAIDYKGKFYGRNIRVSGYGKSFEDRGSNNRDKRGNIDEHWNYGVFKKYDDAIDGAIRLPIKETPEYHNNNFSDWAKVDNVSGDDLPSIQKAIDSGKPIVYLPQGGYKVSNTIVLRGGVRKFLGLNAYISKTDNFPKGKPLFRFDGGSGNSTIIQNVAFRGDIEHNSSKTLAIVNSGIGFKEYRYYNTARGTGELFMEDVLIPIINVNHPQDVWVRQLNAEFARETFFYNNGGKVWIMGYKTEGKEGTLLHNKGGSVELLAGFLYSNNGRSSFPMIINENGNLTANYKVNGPPEKVYLEQVRDIRGNTIRTFKKEDAPDGNNVSLYSSATQRFEQEEIRKLIPGRIQAEDFARAEGVRVSPTTDVSGADQIGFIEGGDFVEYDVLVSEAGTYELGLRVASNNATGGTITFSSEGENLGRVEIPFTGAWDEFTEVFTELTLAAGPQTLRLDFIGGTKGLVNINWLEFIPETSELPELSFRRPFFNQNFEVGEEIAVEVFVRDGDAIEKVELFLDGELVRRENSAPYTWNSSQNKDAALRLPAGRYTLKAAATAITGATQDASILITVVDPDGPNGPTGPTPQSPTARNLIPGRIQAEDFARAEGVRVSPTTDVSGADQIGFIEGGDFVEYDVLVSEAGTYELGLKVASNNATGGTITFSSEGKNLGMVEISSTGAWDEFTEVFTELSFAAGPQTLRLDFIGGTKGLVNINWLEFIPETSELPELSFRRPFFNQNFEVGEEIAVEVSVRDGDVIEKVELFLDGELVRRENSAPYTWNSSQNKDAALRLPVGRYTLEAVATAENGASRSASLLITIVDNMDDPTAPTPPSNGDKTLRVVGDQFTLGGAPFDMWGIRVASASQKDDFTDELISQLDTYKAYGVNTVTVFYQGSSGGSYDPFTSDGSGFRTNGHRNRMDRIIEACAARDMVVVVGIFYQMGPNKGGGTANLSNWNASKEAVRTVAKHLKKKNYRNVILNIANEQNSGNYSALPWSRVRNTSDLIELVEIANEEWPELYVGCGGYDHKKNEAFAASKAVEVLLFDSFDPEDSEELFERFKARMDRTKPAVNVEQFGGWTKRFTPPAGNYDAKSGRNEHLKEIDRAARNKGLYTFFHSNVWYQGASVGARTRFDLGGQGTQKDPGVEWYFKYVKETRGISSTAPTPTPTPSPDPTPPSSTCLEFEEKQGLVVMEAENTSSDWGKWILKEDVEGYTGSGHLEYQRDGDKSGPATSPLKYTFKINKGGYYRMMIRARKRLAGAPSDRANDGFVRMEGDFGTGPNPGNQHNDDASLDLLKQDVKMSGGDANSWAWAEQLSLGHGDKRYTTYNFKAGETYTLVISGRSGRWNIDRIVLYHLEDVGVNNGKRTSNGETKCEGSFKFTDASDEALSSGLDELSPEFLLHPNPSDGLVSVEFNRGDPSIIQILDISGRLLREHNVSHSSMEINLSELTTGMYFFQVVYANGKRKVKRLAIQY